MKLAYDKLFNPLFESIETPSKTIIDSENQLVEVTYGREGCEFGYSCVSDRTCVMIVEEVTNEMKYLGQFTYTSIDKTQHDCKHFVEDNFALASTGESVLKIAEETQELEDNFGETSEVNQTITTVLEFEAGVFEDEMTLNIIVWNPGFVEVGAEENPAAFITSFMTTQIEMRNSSETGPVTKSKCKEPISVSLGEDFSSTIKMLGKHMGLFGVLRL